MSTDNLYKVLLSSVVSEKSSIGSSQNQYTFKVLKSANKQDVKRAVKLLFGVDVVAVQTLNMKGKKKVFARKIGQRNDWKKAIIRVAEGQMIDLASA